MNIDRAITVLRPRAEVYQFWRDFENFPRFMQHLELVQVSGVDRKMSHWVSKGPLDTRVEWSAEITDEREGERIAWRSLPGSQIENSGSVIFQDAPGDRGTEVLVTLEYGPPGGKPGALVARLLGEEPEKQIHDDLRRFKQIMEVGEISTVLGQTSGRLPEVEKERAQLHPTWQTAGGSGGTADGSFNAAKGGGRTAEQSQRQEAQQGSQGSGTQGVAK